MTTDERDNRNADMLLAAHGITRQAVIAALRLARDNAVEVSLRFAKTTKCVHRRGAAVIIAGRLKEEV